MRRTLLTAAAVVACTLFRSPVRAQRADDYLALVRTYAAGQGGSAVTQLARWRRDDVTNAVRAVAPTSSPATLIAAAMLETDFANTIIDADVAQGRFAITTAQELLNAGRRAQNDRVNAFTCRWFEFVASMYVSAGHLDDAAWYVRAGLLEFPRDSMLYVVRGTIAEMGTRMALVPDLRHRLPDSPRRREQIEHALKPATSAYQLAADADDRNAVAWLHIGWIEFFLDDNRAKAHFDGALARASDDTIRYLAHLFLGGIAERQHQPADALREYEAARLVGARYQTPYVAISRIEESLGHGERARDLALLGAQIRKDDDDPWWDFRIVLDRPALTWLRAEARRP